MPSAEKKYTVRVVGDARSVKRSFRDAETAADKFARRMKRVGGTMSSFGDKMSRRVTLPIVAGLALATKAAVDEEKEMALLSKAMQANADATDEQVAATERWITATQNATGIADGQLRPALAMLVRTTKDTSKAQDILTTAMDISVGTGRSLESITLALVRAYNGSVGGLSRLGIATKNAKGETLTFDQVMAKAVKTYGGSAAKAAETTAGKLAILKARFADVSENIGNAVIPILEKLLPYVEKAAKWFEGLSDGQRDLMVKAGLAVAALGPLLSILGRLITVGGALVKVFGAIRAAIAAMTVAAQAANASGFFQAGKWTSTATSAGKFAAVLARVAPAIAVVGTAGALAAASLGTFKVAMVNANDTTHNFYGGGKGGKSRGFQKLHSDADTATSKVHAVTTALTKVGKMHVTATIGIGGTALSQVERLRQALLSLVARAWNVVVRTLTSGPAVPRAKGGDEIVTKPTLFLAGEAGPERATFTPLGRGRSSGAGPGVGNVTIPIYLDGREIAAYAVDMMRGEAVRLARGRA